MKEYSSSIVKTRISHPSLSPPRPPPPPHPTPKMSNLGENVESLIQCSLCLETLREPKLLPCLHRFCLECLENAVRALGKGRLKSFSCPLCREEIVIPPEGPRGFKTDFFVAQLTAYLNENSRKKVDTFRKDNLIPFKVDDKHFADGIKFIDNICPISKYLVVTRSSFILTKGSTVFLEAFDFNGRSVMCIEIQSTKSGPPLYACVAAVDDDRLIIGCSRKLLIMKIPDQQTLKITRLPQKERRITSVTANTGIIVVSNNVKTNLDIYDSETLELIQSVSIDHCVARNMVSVFMIEEHLALVPYRGNTVLISNVTGDRILKTIVSPENEPNCTPLSICTDSRKYVYVLWRKLRKAKMLNGKQLYHGDKLLVRYVLEETGGYKQVASFEVDEQSHRICVQKVDEDVEKLILATRKEFYSCDLLL